MAIEVYGNVIANSVERYYYYYYYIHIFEYITQYLRRGKIAVLGLNHILLPYFPNYS